MTRPTLNRRRNLTLECCKLIAACFVVFIHVPFPQIAGEFALCLARFAVPMFFAISGWYSFRTAPEKLLRRMGHVLLLELAGIAVMELWRCAAAAYTGQNILHTLLGTLPNGAAVRMWLLFSDDPFSGHLWYLSASAFCYGVLWLYMKLCFPRRGYRPLYLLGPALLCAHLSMAELSRYTHLTVFFKIPRSGLFYGLPMFLLGLFLREHRDTLLGRLKTSRLVLLILLGTGLSLAEWKFFGVYDLYIGLVLTVSGILLLTARHSSVPRWMEQAAALCGPVSTGIYLIHLAVHELYLSFFQWRGEVYFGAAEPWLRPLTVLAMSLAISLCWTLLHSGCRKLLKKA